MTRALLSGIDEAQSIPTQRPTRITTHNTKEARASLVGPILSLFFMGTLDVLLTLIGFQHGGHEVNPYALLVMRGGFTAFVTARIATLAAASLAILWLAPAAPRVARVCTITLAVFFALVNAFSFFQLVPS